MKLVGLLWATALAAAAAWAGPPAGPGAALLAAKAGNAPAPLATPVPYTGAELVHPSVFHRDGGWNGYAYWLAVTPYARSEAQYENPSLYCSQDGLTWTVPPGLTNPLIPKPAEDRRYNSDCHLAGDPDGRLHLFYRAAGADRNDTLFLVSSRDGRHWTAPKVILDEPLADERELSPAVFWAEGRWVMYYVDASSYPYAIRRRTAERPEGPWSPAREVQGIAPPPGRMLWHLDAFPLPGATVLLVDITAVYRTQAGGALYFAVSADGLRFTRAPEPVLAGSSGWDSTIYRSCCLPLAGGRAFAIWYSAWGADLGWRLGFTRLSIAAALSD
jgi:hypothetical protein